MRRLTLAVALGLLGSSLGLGSTTAAAATRPVLRSTVALSAAECAAEKQAKGCTETVTITETAAPVKGAVAPGIYWVNGFTISVCSGGGCWAWAGTNTGNFKYDGRVIYNYTGAGPGCTASGYGSEITYCGYWYNGGQPYGYIEYIMDVRVCVAFHSIGCFNHGTRLDVRVNGTFGNQYAF